MQSRKELFRVIYEAFNARDIDAVLATMHLDVDWPNGLEGGRIVGRDNVRKYWERQWKTIDPHVEPIRFEDDHPDRTVISVHQIVRDLAGNILADQVVQHVYTVQYDLIVRMDIRQQGVSLS
jgi:hypothetical protein